MISNKWPIIAAFGKMMDVCYLLNEGCNFIVDKKIVRTCLRTRTHHTMLEHMILS